MSVCMLCACIYMLTNSLLYFTEFMNLTSHTDQPIKGMQHLTVSEPPSANKVDCGVM